MTGACRPNFEARFSEPPPPWLFEDAFIYPDGPLNGQGGWAHTPSLDIVSNTLRSAGSGVPWNTHAVEGQDLGLGWFGSFTAQFVNSTQSQVAGFILFDAGNNQVALLDVRNQGGNVEIEVDDATGFIIDSAPQATQGVPHLYQLSCDPAGFVEVREDGVLIVSGTLDFAGAVPVLIRFYMIVGGATVNAFVVNLAVGRA